MRPKHILGAILVLITTAVALDAQQRASAAITLTARLLPSARITATGSDSVRVLSTGERLSLVVEGGTEIRIEFSIAANTPRLLLRGSVRDLPSGATIQLRPRTSGCVWTHVPFADGNRVVAALERCALFQPIAGSILISGVPAGSSVHVQLTPEPQMPR